MTVLVGLFLLFVTFSILFRCLLQHQPSMAFDCIDLCSDRVCLGIKSPINTHQLTILPLRSAPPFASLRIASNRIEDAEIDSLPVWPNFLIIAFAFIAKFKSLVIVRIICQSTENGWHFQFVPLMLACIREPQTFPNCWRAIPCGSAASVTFAMASQSPSLMICRHSHFHVIDFA